MTGGDTCCRCWRWGRGTDWTSSARDRVWPGSSTLCTTWSGGSGGTAGWSRTSPGSSRSATSATAEGNPTLACHINLRAEWYAHFLKWHLCSNVFIHIAFTAVLSATDKFVQDFYNFVSLLLPAAGRAGVQAWQGVLLHIHCQPGGPAGQDGRLLSLQQHER